MAARVGARHLPEQEAEPGVQGRRPRQAPGPHGARPRQRGRAHGPQLNLSGLKYPSGASPNSLGLPSHVETEDDVLHIRELPSFDDALGQADCELLISFLTVPYLRMPLSLEFFATNSRLHALASKDVRRLLQSIVLGRAAASPRATRRACPPTSPPSTTSACCSGTSYGLLSECAHAPQLVPVFMLSLLRQVGELDTHVTPQLHFAST